ncbi:fimbria/pilus outer membrane usher protein [Cupriavidus agavae]|uniref:Outer membrane usher protein n=1 Tax=Cupriavidus agavae TaxID=1001822 RepID=A0A4Q7SBA6_9BURK|nr:fimbria/pilus outer membrane usher protein [Cupriavidus agavae]RZT42958.1 outer membrane usher protein [Cupriavidus agavae]
MRARPQRPAAPRRLVAHWLLAAAMPAAAMAGEEPGGIKVAEVQFNPDFFRRPNGSSVDVRRFARGNTITPGDYPVDVYLNGRWEARQSVRFRTRDGERQPTPCMDRTLLGTLNLDERALSPAYAAVMAGENGACVQPADIADDFTWSFDFNELRLDLKVAQTLLRRSPRGTVDPSLWEEGVPSATVAYNLNTFHATGQDSTYLGVDSGINIGRWHLRQRSSMTWQGGAGTRSYDYQNIAAYVQRDIEPLRSQLTLGDAFTDGAVFDSFSVRGVNLATDDRMLPDSSRGYAPVVRGVARSNARVTVTQNGNKLYETTVAPGPFEIDDLYATGYGGNLIVTVTEADGSQSSFTVPYSSVVQLLRPGTTRYSATVGEYRNGSSGSNSREKLVQATVQHGFSNFVTGYGGLVMSEGYQAGIAGAAFNLPIGALALDGTYARASISDTERTSGQSLRVSYSKYVPSTSTSVAVAAYRYATRGFWTMRDAFQARSDPGRGAFLDRARSQVQLTLNQNLGERWGNVYLTGSSVTYWNRDTSALTFQAGYSNAMNLLGLSVSYNLSVSRQRDAFTGSYSTQAFLNLIVPLGGGRHAPMLTMGATRDGSGQTSQQLRLSGTALEDNAFTYGLNADRNRGSTTTGANVQYRSPFTTLSASVTRADSYTQYSGGLQGALVAHAGGVTLANFLGDTIGIVEAKGAAGAAVLNSPGVRIDPFGYAIVPYLQPYNMNAIELDPRGMPLDVSLDATSMKVAPRANAAVKIAFATLKGRSAILSAPLPDGTPLPFGAAVADGKGGEVGMVGQRGIIFARGLEDVGRLEVTWGKGAAERCEIAYRLPESSGKAASYARVKAVCRTSTEEKS